MTAVAFLVGKTIPLDWWPCRTGLMTAVCWGTHASTVEEEGLQTSSHPSDVSSKSIQGGVAEAFAAGACLQEDRWIGLPPMPTPRAGAAVAVLGKQLLVVGGVGEDQSPLKVVEIYNTEEGRWRKRSALREALMGVSISVKGWHCRKVYKVFVFYSFILVPVVGVHAKCWNVPLTEFQDRILLGLSFICSFLSD